MEIITVREPIDSWFKKHFKKRLRRFQNNVILKMLDWFLLQKPSSCELSSMYREIEENPDIDFFARFTVRLD